MATIKTNDPDLSYNIGYIEVSRQYNNGDGTGRFITYKYRGSKDALRLASINWVRNGAKYQISEDGPYSEATVTFSGTNFDPNTPNVQGPLDEDFPSERFEFHTEYVEKSIFELPAAVAEAKLYTETIAGKTVSDYFGSIKNASDDPINNKLEFNVLRFPVGFKLFNRLVKGQSSFQTHRVSLSRVSLYSSRNGLPATPPIISAIYDSITLSNRNVFPQIVRKVMPQAPLQEFLNQPEHAWAWLKTNDSTSLIIKTNQVERNETWTFASWDTFVYPYNPTY